MCLIAINTLHFKDKKTSQTPETKKEPLTSTNLCCCSSLKFLHSKQQMSPSTKFAGKTTSLVLLTDSMIHMQLPPSPDLKHTLLHPQLSTSQFEQLVSLTFVCPPMYTLAFLESIVCSTAITLTCIHACLCPNIFGCLPLHL